ncbi:MAG: DUF4314 domain-containing protein [Firmicutes bacterium HGW-Firmicutes-9]|jgi:glutamate mutase epsilon subunit|nr:MAG: DUF4314 domain-containing protein [Firmicutes bacterium HGW-Firmicutes-9]
MTTIHPEMLKQLKEYYTSGTRVMLIRMSDPYTNLRQGDTGAVTMVDDIGTIHVSWDNGSTLGVVFGEDECRRIEENE